LKLIQKIKKLIIPPVVIPIIAIFMAFLCYVIFSPRVLFIYDPFTLRISNLTIPEIKRIGLRHHLFVRPIAATYDDFPFVFFNLSDRDKSRGIIITAHLYSMLKNNEKYADFFNNSRIFIYGPLFDYEQSTNAINVSVSISDKPRLKYFLKELEKLIFFIPESIYGRANFVEPENTLISLLIESFYSARNNGTVEKLPLAENFRRDSIFFEDNSLTVLCIRRITPSVRNLVTEADGKILFFDYVNSRNLAGSIYVNESGGVSMSLSYDYRQSLHKIFKVMTQTAEKKIGYKAVFTLFP